MLDATGALGNLILVGIIIGATYVVMIAPVQVLRGEAKHNRDYVAGAIGMLFWAWLSKSIVAN